MKLSFLLFGFYLLFLFLSANSQGILLYAALLCLALAVLIRAANWLVAGITEVAQYLKWREFVIAFFVMAIGSSLPNLFIGITAALDDIPQLSLGDVVGNNVIDFSLVIALAVFLGGTMNGESRVVQASTFFTSFVAITPILLLLDGTLGRGDALVLLLMFVFYSVWLFSHRKLFGDNQKHQTEAQPILKFRGFLLHIAYAIAATVMIGFSAQGIVKSSLFFADTLQIPIVLIGIFVIGFGDALPEIFFTLTSARHGKNWLILGNLTGAVVVLSTLVLGTVALINPIEVGDFSPFAIARLFLMISSLCFLIFLRTDRKITKREAFVLFSLYILFLAAEILTQR